MPNIFRYAAGIVSGRLKKATSNRRCRPIRPKLAPAIDCRVRVFPVSSTFSTGIVRRENEPSTAVVRCNRFAYKGYRSVQQKDQFHFELYSGIVQKADCRRAGERFDTLHECRVTMFVAVSSRVYSLTRGQHASYWLLVSEKSRPVEVYTYCFPCLVSYDDYHVVTTPACF